MLQKDYVNAFLSANYDVIQKARQRDGFSWKPVVQQIKDLHKDIDLDPENEVHRDRVRNNFLNIRRRKDQGRPYKAKLPIQGHVFPKIPFCTTYKGAKPKRLLYDIETSPNIVFSWNIGRKCYLDMENIIKERAIICISYKWEDEKEVHCLTWDKGNDKEMLKKFVKILDSADETVTHNGDNYDLKWVRARCLFYGIPAPVKVNSIDTLKMARAQFRLNSNKLNYIAQFLGLGKKVDTGGFNLWKEICLDNSKEAMDKMVEYCMGDVELLEKVYKVLRNYSPVRAFKQAKIVKDATVMAQ